MFSKKGFTLVEVILVVVILGILAAVVIPRITYSRRDARIAACDANVSALNSQIELYRVDKGDFPATLDTLVPDYINSVPTCEFGTAYVYPGTDNRVVKHVAADHP